MKTITNHFLTENEIRFILAVNATWTVLRQPVLTQIYMREWQQYATRWHHPMALHLKGEKMLTLYGYVFNIMYHAV